MDDELNDLGSVERKITAVRTVRRIVHAIGLVSRAEYARAERHTIESVVYYRWLDDAVARLVASPKESQEPRLCVIVGPERPLCGSLAKAVERCLPEDGEYALVGSRLVQHPELLSRAVFAVRGVSGADEIEQLALELGARISEHGAGRDVELIFPVSAEGQMHRELLLTQRVLRPEPTLEMYSPVEQVLPAVLEQALAGRIAHALAQTLQAELSARIQITQRARSNCDDRLQQLTDRWRVVQKEEITLELGEVVAARQLTREN